MRRISFVIIILIAITAVVFALYGCKDKTQYFSVSFSVNEDYNTDTPDTVTVAKGTLIEAPVVDAVPEEGYALAWFVDTELTVAFDFSTPITSNITLYLGEIGLIYSINYTNIDEDWFDVSALPTEYQVGEEVSLPTPHASVTKGFHAGNWFVADRMIGYKINEFEIGHLTLTFKVNPIVYDIGYTNIIIIDGGDNYSAYLTNDNPLTYKVTDGTILLKAPTISEDCPHPPKVFLHWERVSNPSIRQGELITELEIDLFVNNVVFLRAIWVFED